ncbi:transporter substrate-binding domain-containing protein [Peptoniphilus sp. KCTC 25270]|uniref:transporter substrate-binding domain-containing protein n=1 Tax=Peptoniphilus sp. KCTC 25270 TaxID=2897414 RepID=UPI001E2ADDFC|nr:transporter substrate-binding domain-containing protein [Peptoniphilus sp. KCTC 25270]MCD1146802.1 transporter substrate-binding domain-containing protein [Peptoniphilus sp. KCTC 25270]
MKKTIILSLILSLGMFLLVGCGSDTEQPKNENGATTEAQGAENTGATEAEGENIAKIKEKGELVLATCADYPPFEWHMNVDGKDTIVGFDIAIAQEIADELGVELVIKDLDFESVIPSLTTNQADIAIAGLVPSPEREKIVNFSQPYFKNGQVVVVNKADADKYKTTEDFAGKKIGAQTGSTQEEIVRENFPKDIEILSLSKINNLIMEVKNKTADGVVMIDNSAEQYVAQNDDIVMLDVGIPDEQGTCIATAKDKQDLTDFVNKKLQQLMDEGKVEEYVSHYNALISESNAGN